MTGIAARKQARRFFGSMGAAMRCTSRWTEPRRDPRVDAMTRHPYGYAEIRHADLARDLMAH